jgi:ABC-type multidrug transport system fused ATPase/permease subunit
MMLDLTSFRIIMALAALGFHAAFVMLLPLMIESRVNAIVQKRREIQSHDDYVRGRNEGLTEFERKFFRFLVYCAWVPVLNVVIAVTLWIFQYIRSYIALTKECNKSFKRTNALLKPKPKDRS